MVIALILAALAGSPFVLAAPPVAAATPSPGLPAAGSFATPPVAVGGTHTCVLAVDTSVYCWTYDNRFGQRGDGTVSDPELPAGDVLVVSQVSGGSSIGTGAACFDYYDGGVEVCGSTNPLTGVTAIAAGYSHTCALLTDTTVKCWGSNAVLDGGTFNPSLHGGELGDGTTTPRPTPVSVIAGPGETAPLSGVKALTAATGYTCALMIDTTAKCWGGATQTASLAPVAVMADDTLPLSQIVAISAGDFNACAVLLDSSVVCWQYGLPEPVFSSGEPQVPLYAEALTLGHNVFNGPNGIAEGHSCALQDGEVWCWGWNDVSQLGNGYNSLDGPDAGGFRYDAGPVIAAPGSEDWLSGVTAIAAGGYSTCALINDGSVKCWGLGLGGSSFEGAGAPISVTPVVEPGPQAEMVSVAAGSASNCGVLADGRVACDYFYGGYTVVPGITVAASSTPSPSPTPLQSATPSPGPTTVPSPTALPSNGPDTDPAGLTGDWNVTYGSPTTVSISYAEGTYSVNAAAPVQVVDASCFLPVGTLVATFVTDGSGGLTGQHGLWQTNNCSFARWAPMDVEVDAGNQKVTFSLAGGDAVTLTRQPPPTSRPSPTPDASLTQPEAVVGYWQDGRYLVSFANGLYSVTEVRSLTVNGHCPIAAGTVVATFSGSGGTYSGEASFWGVTNCKTTSIPATFTFDGETLTETFDFGQAQHNGPGFSVWHRSSGRSLFRNSIPAPWEINLAPEVTIPAVVLGIGVIFLVPFPGALFNSTLSGNYAEIMRRARRARRRIRNLLLAPWFLLRDRLGTSVGPAPVPVGEEQPITVAPPATDQRHDFWWTWPGVAVFVLLTALLSGFLDPTFGFDPASIATFVGMLVGLVVIMAGFDAPSFLYYRRHAITFWPRALPATIVVALACVVISRVTDFHPGYLYGLVVTVAVTVSLDHKTEGKLLALGALLTIGLALVAWVLLGLVAPAAAASASAPLITLQTVLSMVVADGVQVAAIAMVPISVFAGDAIRKWNRWLWAGIWLFGIVTFCIVILNPQNGYLSDTTRTPFLTIIALLIVFSVGSILFWAYFRRWHKRMAKARTELAAEGGDGR